MNEAKSILEYKSLLVELIFEWAQFSRGFVLDLDLDRMKSAPVMVDIKEKVARIESGDLNDLTEIDP